jgi:glycosyltransferase involved in cell wall biosynthesis
VNEPAILMKIAYDHQIFSGQCYGGISRYFCEIAKRIEAFPDCEVRIYAPLHINVFAKSATAARVRGIWTPTVPRTQRLRQAVNAAVVRRLLAHHPPDVVHETYYDECTVAPKSSMIVTTVHDMIQERLPELMPRHDNTAHHKAISTRRADHIICVSQSTKNDLIDILAVNPDQISVVYLGNSIRACTTPSEIKEPRHEPFILYVGLRAGYKNFGSFLKAFGSSSRLKRDFKLICFGGPRFSNREMRELRNVGLQAKVDQVTGTDETLAHLYSSASCLVYPSLYEGFGIPVLEAMACECPVVCSGTSSLPEVAQDAAEYCDPLDIGSIRTAIERVVYSEQRRSDLVLRGKIRAAQFSWERCASQTFAIYSSLTTGGPCHHQGEAASCALS